MRKLLLLTLVFLNLSFTCFCQTLKEKHEQKMVRVTNSSPCSDSLYLASQKVSFEKMTEREYQYFLQKDIACSEFQKIGEAQVSSMTLVENEIKAQNTIYIFCALILVFVLVAATAQ